jgi:hypothetical protein
LKLVLPVSDLRELNLQSYETIARSPVSIGCSRIACRRCPVTVRDRVAFKATYLGAGAGKQLFDGGLESYKGRLQLRANTSNDWKDRKSDPRCNKAILDCCSPRLVSHEP